MSGTLQTGLSPAEPRETTAKILIADDSIGVCRYLKAFLLNQNNQWSVCGEAYDGEQAVWLASRLKPDLILLDLAMPILGGLQAAEEILKAQPSVPIILFTLHKSDWVSYEAKKMGVKKVVSKSETTAALLDAIRELLGQESSTGAAND